MNQSDDYIETIEINGNYLEEQRDQRERRQSFRLRRYQCYERRSNNPRRHRQKVDTRV